MKKTKFIVAGTFIDGTGAAHRKNIFLAVKNGIITDIGPESEIPHTNVAVIEDFSNCTIVPALIDCCVFLSRSPSVDAEMRFPSGGSFEKKSAMVERHIHYCHSHGVLGVAEGDDIEDFVKGKSIFIRAACNLNQKSQDCYFIKINYSRDIENEKSSGSSVSYEALCRILKHRGKKKAIVVANGQQHVAEAIEAGCDAIEQGYAMGEDNLKNMGKKNILWIPSVLRAKNVLDASRCGGDVSCRFSTRYVAPGKSVSGVEAFWKKKLTEQLNQLRLARKLDVTTALGTGAGCVGILHGESMVEEMKLFIKAGYSLEETIKCASENGAKFFKMEQLGTLTVGHHATFLITRGSVKQLPRKLSYLEGIYVGGIPSPIYHKNPVMQ